MTGTTMTTRRWRLLGLVGAIGNAALLLVALYLGFQLEGTTEAIARAEHGQGIAVAAVPGLCLGVAGMVGAGRMWGRVLIAAGTVLALAGLLVWRLG